MSQEQFNKIEMEYGCGYWNMCWEHACPCAITTENKGLTEKIYNDFVEENRQIAENWDLEFPEDTYDDDYSSSYWDDDEYSIEDDEG